MSGHVLVVGEILWDLLPGGPVLGGAPFNMAFRLAERGIDTRFVSRIGNDELGRRARDKASELGMDTSLIQLSGEKPTGTVEIAFSGGEPDYYIVPDVAYDEIQLTEELKQLASRAKCICYGTLCQRSEGSRATILSLLDESGGAAAFCDINLRKDCYSEATVESSIRRADILKLNHDEVAVVSRMLFGEELSPESFAGKVSNKFNVRIVLVTLGAEGALALPADNDKVYVPGYSVELIDTVGSGDAFSAGFLYRFHEGDSLAECCDYGCLLGASAASLKGGTGRVDDALISCLKGSAGRVIDKKYY